MGRRRIVRVRFGDEIVWEEGKHPRKGKGPGGGEFTRGAGGGGGSSAGGAGTTVHVHQEAQPGSHAAFEAEYRQDLEKEAQTYLDDVDWRQSEASILQGFHAVSSHLDPKGEALKAELHQQLEKEAQTYLDDVDWKEPNQEADQLLKSKLAQQRNLMPGPGEPGRLEALVGEVKAKKAAFKKATATARMTLHEAGYDIGEVPRSMKRELGIDDSLPPADPARLETAAKAYDGAVKALHDGGLDALADEITKHVPVLMGTETKVEDGKIVPDGGTLMSTLSGGDQDGQFVMINPNSTPTTEWPIGKYSPMLAVELKAKLDAGAKPEELVAQEMQGAAIHEFGHVLDNWNGSQMTKGLGLAMKSFLGDDWTMKASGYLGRTISGYAASNPYEATAEAFYMMVTRGGPKALPKELQGWGEYWMGLAKTGRPPLLKYKAAS